MKISTQYTVITTKLHTVLKDAVQAVISLSRMPSSKDLSMLLNFLERYCNRRNLPGLETDLQGYDIKCVERPSSSGLYDIVGVDHQIVSIDVGLA